MDAAACDRCFMKTIADAYLNKHTLTGYLITKNKWVVQIAKMECTTWGNRKQFF